MLLAEAGSKVRVRTCRHCLPGDLQREGSRGHGLVCKAEVAGAICGLSQLDWSAACAWVCSWRTLSFKGTAGNLGVWAL